MALLESLNYKGNEIMQSATVEELKCGEASDTTMHDCTITYIK